MVVTGKECYYHLTLYSFCPKSTTKTDFYVKHNSDAIPVNGLIGFIVLFSKKSNTNQLSIYIKA